MILGSSEKLTTHRFDRYLSKLRHIFKFIELQLYEESFTLKAVALKTGLLLHTVFLQITIYLLPVGMPWESLHVCGSGHLNFLSQDHNW